MSIIDTAILVSTTAPVGIKVLRSYVCWYEPASFGDWFRPWAKWVRRCGSAKPWWA